MMQLKKYLKISSVLVLSSFLVGCSLFRPKEVIVTKPVVVEQIIPIKKRPKPIQTLPVEFKAVNDKNLEEFIQYIVDKYGRIVFLAVEMPIYENLSLNIAEIRRYVEQQHAIILYYEEQIKRPESPEKEEEENK